MFNKILSKLNPTENQFYKELLKKDFNEDILKDLLHKGININHIDDNKDSFLHLCIKQKLTKSSLWLIENNCDINIKNNEGESIIRLAIKFGNYAVTKALLKTSNIDINEINAEGRTLLHDAVMSGSEEIVNELMNCSVDINIKDKNNKNVLFDAIAYGEDKIISKILSSNELEVNTTDIDGNTILHKNEVLSDDNLAKKLLQYGADPTINDKEGKNFLYHTALRGEEGAELLDIALSKGCNINQKIRNNNSILMEIMFAFTNLSEAEKNRRAGLIDMASKFIEYDIDINAINNQGETALFDAVRKDDIEAVAFLLDNGVDVNRRNKKFETALSIAVIKGIKALDIILLLMDFKADITVKVKDVKTIIEVLNDIILHTHNNHQMENLDLLTQIDVDEGKYLVVLRDILSKINVKLDYNDFSGEPIYFKSLLYGNLDLFRMYVKYGIDINKRNIKGRTLFHQYVIKIFESNLENEYFEQILLLLANSKVDTNAPMPSDGKTIISYITLTECNVNLFKILLKNIRFNFKLQDNLGRTVIHSCVTGNNIEIIKILSSKDPDLLNIADCYNILPITYAALFGNTKMVLEMIKLNSQITSDIKITSQAKNKFSQLLPNLDKLKIDIYNNDDLRKINILIEQVTREFQA